MLVREVSGVRAHQGQNEEVVRGLGHIAVTDAREDDAGQRSAGDTRSSSKEVEVAAHWELLGPVGMV